jgi:hypothetical protein
MHHHSLRFIDNQQILILIYYCQRYVLGYKFSFPRRGYMNRNQFAFLDPVTGLDPPAFNLDFTVFDKFGCRNPRQPFRLLTYVLVKPLPVVFFLNYQGHSFHRLPSSSGLQNTAYTIINRDPATIAISARLKIGQILISI